MASHAAQTNRTNMKSAWKLTNKAKNSAQAPNLDQRIFSLAKRSIFEPCGGLKLEENANRHVF
ncbi:hypothetical protein FIV00_05435 [Labrenzia sp. THAF82]|nr:hypothetical protein FIV00_05435 [Labrenzia sp. THAF82]